MGFNSVFKGLIKLEFSRQTVEKNSSIEFHGIPSSGSGFIAWGRKERQTDMTS